jgi:hypothetical protein
VIGHPAQQGLDGLDVVEEAPQFLEVLAVRVARPRRQSLDQSLDRRAEQDDVIELRVELRLILLAAGDEQDVRVLSGQRSAWIASSRHI